MDKTISVRLVAKVGQYNQGLASSAAQTRQFGTDVQGSAKRASSAATSLAATSALAGKAILLGIGGAMAVSAKAAVEYESSMTGVAKTTDLAGNAFDRADSPLARFGDRLRALSTRIPVNVNDLARIAELGGQLGIQVPNLVDFTETIAKLGVTTNLSTEEGATSLARFVNIMGTSQNDFDRLGSTIVDLGNNFATTEKEILSFGIRLAPIGATIGASEAEVLALSTALTSLGIPAERGGTALQRVFIKMKSAVDSGGESLDKFASATGMTAENFADLFRQSPARAFAALAKGLDGVSRSGGNVFQVLDDLELAEQRTVATLLATASGYELVEDAITRSEDAYRDNIALNEEAALRFGTNASQIQLLGNAFTDLKIEIGNSLIGRGGLIAATDIAREFLGIIGDNIDAVGGFTKVLGGVAVIASTLGLNKVLTSLVAKVIAWKKLTVAVKGGTAVLGGAKLALAGLGIASTVALGALGLVAAIWLVMATRAAKLRAEVRLLNSEIENGVSPTKALIDSLTEDGLVNPRLTEALHRQGITLDEWAEAAFKGKDAVDELLGMSATDLDLFEVTGTSETARDLDAISAASIEATRRTEALFDLKKSKVREEIMGLASASDMTFEEVDHLADRMVDFFGLDVSASEIGKWLSGSQQLGPDFGFGDEFEEESQKMEKTFIEVVQSMGDEGDKILPGLLDSATESVTEYRDHVEESFAEVSASIRDAFPAWDEYEQQTALNLGKVTASQDAYLDDLETWRDNVQFFAEAAPAAFDWIQSLPLETRAALADMIGTKELNDNLVLWEANHQQMNEISREAMMEAAPAIFREGTLAMMQSAIDAVDESDVPNMTGAQYYGGVMMGLEAAASEADLSVEELFRNLNTQDMLDFFSRLGIDLGTALFLGLMDGYGNFDAHGKSVDDVNERLKKGLKDGLAVKSPSRFTFYIGQMLGKGLELGWGDGLRGFDMAQPVERAIQPNAAFTPSITVESARGGPGSYTFAPTVINPKTNSLDRDLRRANTMASAQAEFGG